MFQYNKKNKTKFFFTFEDAFINSQKIDVLLKLRSKNKGIYSKNWILQLVNRKTKEIIEIELKNHIEDDNFILRACIDIESNLQFLEIDTTDIYVKEEDSDKSYRVKCGNGHNLDLNFYYDQINNKRLVFYKTIKGNLSLRYENMPNIAKIENIEIHEDGNLIVEGYAIIPRWNVYDEKNISKELVITLDNNDEVSILMENVIRKDVTETYKSIGKNLDGAGFRLKVSLYNQDIYALRNKGLDLSIRISNGVEKVDISSFENDEEFAKEAYIIQKGNTCKVKIDDVKKHLKLFINNSSEEIQIKTVYINEDDIEITGKMPNYLNYKIYNLDNVYLNIRERKSKREIRIKCKVQKNEFNCKIPCKNIIVEESIKSGIFDLYINIDDKEYRIVNKADGILNKQKIVNLPQIIVPDSQNTAVAIKAYYTIYDELSLLVRNPIAVKKIDSVRVIQEGILIKGLLNIQQPNRNIPNEAKGKIILKGLQGKKYEFYGTWKINFTEKTRLEFSFEFLIDKNLYEQQNIKEEEIIASLDFDLVNCTFKVENLNMQFLMNIDPSKIITEAQTKQGLNSRLNNYVSKNGIKLYELFNKLPISKNIAVFQSFHGKSYACNPKAIHEALVAQNRDIKSVWVLNDINKKIPGNPIVVKPKSIKYYYYMARGKYFINNGNFPDFYKKRDGTVHLQTWHGTPLKKLGFDIDESSPAYKENTSEELMRRNERWDYLIEPNKYTGDILKRAFKYKKEIISSGYPRNDVLIKNDLNQVERVKRDLNIPHDKKVILYAPTWRDYEFHSGGSGQPYEFKFDMDKFKEEFGDEYVLLLRLHYRDAARINITGFENIVYNVSSYDDIQELYLISDILITDYSSVMFDYANLDRPIIFFAYDLNRYGSQVRGFYFNFILEAPGPVVLNQERLFEVIKNIDKVQEDYKERYIEFKEKFCSLEDGRASERVIDIVFK